MITPGSVAPLFQLPDQFGKTFRLSDYRGKKNVLLFFLPAAWTPICTSEMPFLSALRDQFWKDADTLPVVIDVDNGPSNREWVRHHKIANLHVLSDFWPHGAVSESYGAWIPTDGLSDRASVIVAKDGVVRYAESVGKFGKRSVPALLDIARAIDGRVPLTKKSAKMPVDIPVLFTMSGCPYCTEVANMVREHALSDRIVVRSVDTDPDALRILNKVNSQGSVPTLFYNGKIYVGPQKIGGFLQSFARSLKAT